MKAKTDLERANEARARRGLPTVDVGFLYAEAIQRICKDGRWTDERDRERRYKVRDVADCLGITPQRVRDILEGSTDLRHVTAQLLVGLWKDVFQDHKLRYLPMTKTQRSAQQVRK